MLPEIENELVDFEIIEIPTKTYALDFERKIITKWTNYTPALEQAIYKIVLTECNAYLIYDEFYGIYLVDLFGEMPPYVVSEVKRRLEIAILNDDRFVAVDFTDVKYEKDMLTLWFTVTTTQGGYINMEGVAINVRK